MVLNADTTNQSIEVIKILLDYLWIPIVLPLLAFFFGSVIHIKELKKYTDSEIEGFKNLYNSTIKESLRINAEEILQFLDKRHEMNIEHHLYICKKFNKVVGFVKFMYSQDYNYIFIAYIAIDKNDFIAKKYAVNFLVRKIYKKFLKNKKAEKVLAEIECSANGGHITSLAKQINRYAKKYKKQCYVVDLEYMQPSMPDDNYDGVNEEILSLVYIPMLGLSNEHISKSELLNLIKSIYFDIYYPSCNRITGCDCNNYNNYLLQIINLYSNLPEYIDLIKV